MHPKPLTFNAFTQTSIAPAPTGIINNPDAHFSTAGLTPEQIEAKSRATAENAFEYIKRTTATTTLGRIAHSSLRVEDRLAEEAEHLTSVEGADNTTTIATHLTTGASPHGTVAHPEKADAAQRTLIDDIEPAYRPLYFENQTKINELEAKGGSITKQEAVLLKALKADQRRLRRRHSETSSPIPSRPVRGYFRKRNAKSAREGMTLMGKSEEQIEAVLDGAGRHGTFLGVIHTDPSRERNLRERAEAQETRNLVSQKGRVIWFEDSSGALRKHVVVDTYSTPAQALKITSFDKDGNPVFEQDPVTGEPTLMPMYEPDLDKSGNLQYRPDGTVKLKPHPIPRDDRYRSSGKDKTNNQTMRDPRLFYADGTTVHSLAWSEDSFSPRDDIVELAPLFTGEEVIVELDKGGTLDLTRKEVVLKYLVEHVSGPPQNRSLLQKIVGANKHKNVIVDPEEIADVLESEYTYKPEDHIALANPELRPTVDRNTGRGYFAKFTYTDPATEREKRAERYALERAAPRIAKGKKGGRESRQAKIK